MKKFISSLSAKFAMAVLAVCSVFMTACYEKPEPTPAPVPVPAAYHITGTVSDGATGAVVENASVKVDGKAVTLTKGSFKVQMAGPGTYTIVVTADGYMDVTRTVQLVEVADDQVSIASVDIALFSAASLPVPPVTPDGDADLSEDELEDLGFVGAEVVGDGEFVVETSHEVEATDAPVEVVIVQKKGFIFNKVAVKAIDETEYVGRALSAATGLPFYGNAFREEEVTTTIGGNGNILVGYNVERSYNMENYTIDMYDGSKQTFAVIYEAACVVVAVFDVHDNHDNHGGGHGGSDAVGGGSGSEQ